MATLQVFFAMEAGRGLGMLIGKRSSAGWRAILVLPQIKPVSILGSILYRGVGFCIHI